MLDRFKVPDADQVRVSEAVLRQTVTPFLRAWASRRQTLQREQTYW